MKDEEAKLIEQCDEDFGVEPALVIELSREKEMDSLSFGLPKQALMACWPLIAMWPVLWARYGTK